MTKISENTITDAVSFYCYLVKLPLSKMAAEAEKIGCATADIQFGRISRDRAGFASMIIETKHGRAVMKQVMKFVSPY